MDKGIVYRNEIKFKEGYSEEHYNKLKEFAQAAYDNRGGKMKDVCQDNTACIFEGTLDKFGCIAVAHGIISSNKDFFNCLLSWNHTDLEKPAECGSILEIYK